MATTELRRPSWYTDEDDGAWTKIKAAFRRDWQQTKHDFGGKQPDLNQRAGDTMSQAAGRKPIPPDNAKTSHPDETAAEVYDEADEPAYRFGYAASRHFPGDWDDRMEETLRADYGGDETEWERRHGAIRRAWNYGRRENCDHCSE